MAVALPGGAAFLAHAAHSSYAVRHRHAHRPGDTMVVFAGSAIEGDGWGAPGEGWGGGAGGDAAAGGDGGEGVPGDGDAASGGAGGREGEQLGVEEAGDEPALPDADHVGGAGDAGERPGG